ncbi:uncharacterized protein LOC106701857 isoform X1 [Latimeria chalumnae]|uniref:uncharacterized protein LOC106701857 isoform X1 n=1 Tax=Latimeria chalumnae TaxID=7897 RepID=UPI0006D92714|nr:PREDICTED: uncharacterized protein LOC106701857 isoform X4 [Latimeria chalumnae]|eukprot:XP_014339489.1 PREDICTED: uncharacterized protein LOC106701857 isoform X4 [Latimeria chalumnae]
MDFRGHHQLSFGNYSVETPHSPLSLVPDIEGSGLEWFDCAIIDIVRAGQNAEQGVPSSPCSDISKSALSSQDTNFTVPSTPVYFKQEECFNKKDWTPSCKLQATLLSSPQTWPGTEPTLRGKCCDIIFCTDCTPVITESCKRRRE